MRQHSWILEVIPSIKPPVSGTVRTRCGLNGDGGDNHSENICI